MAVASSPGLETLFSWKTTYYADDPSLPEFPKHRVFFKTDENMGVSSVEWRAQFEGKYVGQIAFMNESRLTPLMKKNLRALVKADVDLLQKRRS